MRFSPASRCLVLLACFVSLASAQTVTADFGNRNYSSKRVFANSLGINLASLQNTNSISQIKQAGLTQTRKMANIAQIYATTTANWSSIDWYMKMIAPSGMHPLIVMSGTPSWLRASPNPCGSGDPQWAAPTDVNKWAQLAASYVAHFDKVYPGWVIDYEIWNEPEIQSSFCVSGNTDDLRLSKYLALYAAAASAMKGQASRDGATIRIGGPTISILNLAPKWIPALLSNSGTAPYVDFVSFHMYLTGQTDIQQGMTWNTLYSVTQSATKGELYYYKKIYNLVRAGSQPNAGHTPIYITEYNNNWAFMKDCCRNHATYGPLWNTVAIADFLNSMYAGSNIVPRMYYFAGSQAPYFCITGTYNSAMDCNASTLSPYPQYYAFNLIASPSYLGLSTGAYMATSVSSANTTSGLLATAFFTTAKDAIVVINPTGTNYSAVQVVARNPGIASAKGTSYLLNASNPKITSKSITLGSISGGYSATVAVPAYSVVAVSVHP